MASEDNLKLKLQDLQKQLGKKQLFEEAVTAIGSLLKDSYLSASPSLRKSFYTAVCRVATILKTRYTAPGFWNAGLNLFVEAENLVTDSTEKKHLHNCIVQARDQLNQVENRSEESGSAQNRNSYLFEGHLTVDQEPSQPQWLVESNLLTSAATLFAAQSSQENTSEDAANLLQELVDRLDNVVPMILDDGPVAPRVPPASKEVVAKLPLITVTDEIIEKTGGDAECAICKENLVVNDTMQQLPCNHTFHPPCLKPWLDEHNSCPICRHELQTDDHKYESWKEREKEAEEERKGAANAVRGGEYMYV
jgi:E3 ubiquitin-protein ligase AIP2